MQRAKSEADGEATRSTGERSTPAEAADGTRYNGTDPGWGQDRWGLQEFDKHPRLANNDAAKGTALFEHGQHGIGPASWGLDRWGLEDGNVAKRRESGNDGAKVFDMPVASHDMRVMGITVEDMDFWLGRRAREAAEREAAEARDMEAAEQEALDRERARLDALARAVEEQARRDAEEMAAFEEAVRMEAARRTARRDEDDDDVGRDSPRPELQAPPENDADVDVDAMRKASCANRCKTHDSASSLAAQVGAGAVAQEAELEVAVTESQDGGKHAVLRKDEATDSQDGGQPVVLRKDEAVATEVVDDDEVMRSVLTTRRGDKEAAGGNRSVTWSVPQREDRGAQEQAALTAPKAVDVVLAPERSRDDAPGAETTANAVLRAVPVGPAPTQPLDVAATASGRAESQPGTTPSTSTGREGGCGGRCKSTTTTPPSVARNDDDDLVAFNENTAELAVAATRAVSSWLFGEDPQGDPCDEPRPPDENP